MWLHPLFLWYLDRQRCSEKQKQSSHQEAETGGLFIVCMCVCVLVTCRLFKIYLKSVFCEYSRRYRKYDVVSRLKFVKRFWRCPVGCWMVVLKFQIAKFPMLFYYTSSDVEQPKLLLSRHLVSPYFFDPSPEICILYLSSAKNSIRNIVNRAMSFATKTNVV